jgi:hypothetical protein
MGSFKYALEQSKIKGTKKGDTFGTPYNRYETAIIPEGNNHYFGKGNMNHNGLGPSELDLAATHVRASCSKVPNRRADRGLLSPSSR